MKALEFASTATATGPELATAASRLLSLPEGIMTVPDIEAPKFALL